VCTATERQAINTLGGSLRDKPKLRSYPASRKCSWTIVDGPEHRNKFVPNVSSRWNPLQEAFWFYRAVCAGRMEVDEAIRMIEMTDRHLACLCKTFPADVRLFTAIYQQRKRTLECFIKAYMGKFGLDAMEEAANREAQRAYALARSNTAAGASTAEPE